MFGLGNAIGGIFGTLFGGKKRLSAQQQAEADAIHPVDATKTISQSAAQQLGLAQQMENGNAPGTAAETNNIFSNQANAIATNTNNATSGAQVLAANAAAQGQTNKAFSGLQTQQEQNKVAMLGNLTGAQNGYENQEQQVYQDQVRKFNNDTAAKAALQSAAIQNKMSWNNDLASSVGSIFGGNTGASVPAATGANPGGGDQTTLMSLLQSLFSGGGGGATSPMGGSAQGTYGGAPSSGGLMNSIGPLIGSLIP